MNQGAGRKARPAVPDIGNFQLNISQTEGASMEQQGYGYNSTGVQEQSITVSQESSHRDAKEIALEVFNSNFITLTEEAAGIVKERAEEITNKIISKVIERHPEAIAEFKQPGMQYALFTVQKQYVISGDVNLGDLLVEIIAERANQPRRNILQIVLDESLHIVHKLTNEHLDTITINFLLTETRRTDLKSYDDFCNYIITIISKFAKDLTSEPTCYDYIGYSGCGHIGNDSHGELDAILRKNYKSFFSAGFTKEEFEAVLGDFEEHKELITKCLHDPDKFQFQAYDDEMLATMLREKGRSDDDIKTATELFDKTTMHAYIVKNVIMSISPIMEKVFSVWAGSPLKSLKLTNVGVAIAHANYRRRTGETLDLSMWVV
jgi:hypothetical protein